MWKQVTSLARGLLLILLLAAAGGLGFGWYLSHYANTPAVPGAPAQVVQIPPGAGAVVVAARLHGRGIIENPRLFRFLVRFHERRGLIKAGEYELSGAMPPADILDRLIRGEVMLHRLTIPEGFTAAQIAQAVGRAGLAQPAAFLEAVHDADLIAAYEIPGDSLEGYLFPETYYFAATVTPDRLARTMVKRFFSVFDQSRQQRAEEMGLTTHEVVILASIIEKETAVAAERPLIASVFHNRLNQGMRLDSDPTVIYGIEDFDGDLTRRHLNTTTPYNTYKIRGLPAGPIANPGKASLAAALHPADTDYLYFVANDNGSHQFSTNLADHNRAVRKYQLGR